MITSTCNMISLQASNAAMLAQLLPLLPPVVIGLYVLFAAFWPQRILFFSSKQRRKTMNDQGTYEQILSSTFSKLITAKNGRN